VAGGGPNRAGLTGEAIYLGQLLSELLPNEPETHGLVALMLQCEARRAARRDATGAYVPLANQDVALWSEQLIAQAEEKLAHAARAGRIGRFQLEAAIQSVHAQRAATGRTDWESAALLYEGLVKLAPTIGALTGRAAAVGEARGAEIGLRLLQELPAEPAKAYQPYWALSAHLLARLGRTAEAREAYERAIGLCDDQAMRSFLLRRVEALNAPRRRSGS
jgi:RNA polymerase sigma-70 factor (ECF subfamily)